MSTELPALLPTALQLKAATGPTSQTRVVRESPSQPRHKRRVHGAHAQIGPGSQRLSSVPCSGPSAPRPRPRTLGKENPHEGRPVPSSRPQPGEVSQPSGVARAPTCEQEAPGALEEAAGAGPALRRRDLGAGNGKERLRLHVCAAPASPGHEFDFRVWPQVGHGEHRAREKSPRDSRSLSDRGALPCSTFSF